MQLGDVIVYYPTSGSASGSAGIPAAAFIRTVKQASSASVGAVWQPGAMTGTLPLLARNNNRSRLSIYNSSSLPLLVSHGNGGINPNAAPSANGPWFDRIVASNTVYDEPLPVYTGPITVAWAGSGTLSSSAAFGSEFSF